MNLAYKKILGQFKKFWELGRPRSAYWEKLPNNPIFFFESVPYHFYLLPTSSCRCGSYIRFVAYRTWKMVYSDAGRWQTDMGWTNNSCGVRMSVEQRARQLFFQFSPLPLLSSSFIWLPPILEQREEEVSVLYGRSACSAYRRCWIRRLCTCVYWDFIRVWWTDNSVYGDWSPLAKILRPLKQSTSAVGRLQVCELLKGQILQSGASRLLVLTDHHSRNTPAHTVSSYMYTKLK